MAYANHDDPMIAACNLIALVVASNQPFYPLYVFWMVSDDVWPTYFTFLSTPLFLAVPALARRSPFAGRALLPVAGLGNSVLCVKVFGQESGVEIFLIPCALIAATFFRSSERTISFLLIGATLTIYFALDGRYGTPIHIYSPAEYVSFARLNAMSAATLTIFIGLVASGLISEVKTRT